MSFSTVLTLKDLILKRPSDVAFWSLSILLAMRRLLMGDNSAIYNSIALTQVIRFIDQNNSGCFGGNAQNFIDSFQYANIGKIGDKVYAEMTMVGIKIII